MLGLLAFLLALLAQVTRSGTIEKFNEIEYVFINHNYLGLPNSPLPYALRFCFTLESPLPAKNYLKITLPSNPQLSLDVFSKAFWY